MRLFPTVSVCLALSILAAPACDVPDEPDAAFRAVVITASGTAGGDDTAGDTEDPRIEIPECIVVTTHTEDATSGDVPPVSTSGGAIGDDFHLPDDDSTSTSGGGVGDGVGDGVGAGDDLGLPPDPTGAPACPGEGEMYTVLASNIVAAATLCATRVGHCCEKPCATYGGKPNGSCALAPTDPLLEGESYTDANTVDPGRYVCGCDCEEDLVSNG